MKSNTPQKRLINKAKKELWAKVFTYYYDNPKESEEDVCEQFGVTSEEFEAVARLEKWPRRADPSLDPKQVPDTHARSVSDACRIMAMLEAKDTLGHLLNDHLPGMPHIKNPVPVPVEPFVIHGSGAGKPSRRERAAESRREAIATALDAGPGYDLVDIDNAIMPRSFPKTQKQKKGATSPLPEIDVSKLNPLPVNPPENDISVVESLMSRVSTRLSMAPAADAAMAVKGNDDAAAHRREIYEIVSDKIRDAGKILPVPKTWREFQTAVELARQALGLHERGGSNGTTVQVNVLTNRKEFITNSDVVDISNK